MNVVHLYVSFQDCFSKLAYVDVDAKMLDVFCGIYIYFVICSHVSIEYFF